MKNAPADTLPVLHAVDRLAHARHLVDAIRESAETLPAGPRSAIAECADTAIRRMEKVRDALDKYRPIATVKGQLSPLALTGGPERSQV
jgi:hypothetical protein